MWLTVNASGLPIISFKEQEIWARHHTQEPTVSLDKSFLDQFIVEHEDFETLMEDWFFDEAWPVKKGEIYVLE